MLGSMPGRSTAAAWLACAANSPLKRKRMRRLSGIERRLRSFRSVVGDPSNEDRRPKEPPSLKHPSIAIYFLGAWVFAKRVHAEFVSQLETWSHPSVNSS